MEEHGREGKSERYRRALTERSERQASRSVAEIFAFVYARVAYVVFPLTDRMDVCDVEPRVLGGIFRQVLFFYYFLGSFGKRGAVQSTSVGSAVRPC